MTRLMEVNGNIRVLARVRPMVEVSETQADGCANSNFPCFFFFLPFFGAFFRLLVSISVLNTPYSISPSNFLPTPVKSCVCVCVCVCIY